MKRLTLAAAAVLAAVAVWIGVTLPPAPLTLAPPPDPAPVRGSLHVHTSRSDGSGTPEEIAAAAAHAGLKFVVLTDHGDGTTRPAAPVYRGGVLSLEGVEISTLGGHYLALDMGPSPYPLAGEARDVVDDVRRLGGFGIAAHPDSPKPELRWFEWAAPFDAIELINPDSSWRAAAEEPGWRAKLRLASTVGTYPFRSSATIASLLRDSPLALARWESLTRRRRLVAVGGVDAHAKLELGRVQPKLPGYRASFETLSVYVTPERPLSGDAAADAAAIMGALRNGHTYTAVDAFASPAFLEFTATNKRGTARAGDELVADGPLSLRVRTNSPPQFTTTVWRGDQPFSADHHEQDFTVSAPETPAVYRVEIRATGRDAPGPAPLWILSNPIYVRSAGPAPDLPLRPPATTALPLFDGTNISAWRTETDGASTATLEIGVRPRSPNRSGSDPDLGGELQLSFGLAGGAPGRQFVALSVFPAAGAAAAFDRVSFAARAEGALRVSVQLRAPAGGIDERWQRSVYVDTAARSQTIFFDSLTPVGTTRTYRPPLADVHSVMFVIDTTNSRPGTSGRLWLKDVRLER